MEHDDRDRRDWPQEGTDGPSADRDVTPAPDEPTEPIADPRAEIEAWPSQDASADDETAEQRHPETAPGGERESAPQTGWPTEPPAAGSAPQERTDDEPVPSEVEAYPSDATPEPTPAAESAAAHAVPAAESATGESTQCPRCGTENRPGLAFCRSCGQRLVAPGVASTVERPGVPDGTQACARCGTHNRAGVAFCQNCGANLRGTGAGYVPPAVVEDGAAGAEVERRGAILGPVVLLIGLVGIITGLPAAVRVRRRFAVRARFRGWRLRHCLLERLSRRQRGARRPGVLRTRRPRAAAGRAAPRPGGRRVRARCPRHAPAHRPGYHAPVEPGSDRPVRGGRAGGEVERRYRRMLLRDLSPAGIIFFLAALIVLIGSLTRFGRS